jgi:NADH:ubiquinone oxidoreductase subunit 3 (subunit A)
MVSVLRRKVRREVRLFLAFNFKTVGSTLRLVSCYVRAIAIVKLTTALLFIPFLCFGGSYRYRGRDMGR